MHELQVPIHRLPAVLRTQLLRDHRLQQHPDRLLPFDVLLYVIGESMAVREAGIDYFIKPGDCLILRKGIPHMHVPDAFYKLDILFIHFCYEDDPDAVELERQSTVLYPRNMPSSLFRRYFTLPKVMNFQNHPEIVEKLFHIAELFASAEPLARYRTAAALQDLFVHIYETECQTRSSGAGDPHTRKLAAYLASKRRQNVTSAEIEAFMAMNYRYLCSLFRRAEGISIMHYHTRLRLAEAANLLLSTAMNISQISNTIGYEDPLYFSRIFKTEFGCSPREYRLKHTYANA